MLSIEAKRDRSAEEASSEGEAHAPKLSRTALSTWYTDHAAAMAATTFYADKAMVEGTDDIDSDESLLANIENVYSASTTILADDFSYLSVFPHLQHLKLKSGEAERPLRNITLSATGLDRTAVTSLTIVSRNSMRIVGIAPAFWASLGKLVSLKIACPIQLLREGVPPGAVQPTSNHLLALRTLELGTMPRDEELEHTIDNESFIDVVETGIFHGLAAIEKLTLTNVAVSWPNGDTPPTRRPLMLTRIAPTVETLRLRHMVAPLGDPVMGETWAPETWVDAMPSLRNLFFRNVAVDDVGGMSTFLHGLQYLKHIEFANQKYNVEEVDVENNVFVTEFTVPITIRNTTALQHLVFQRVNVTHLILGDPVPDELDEWTHAIPFTSLETVALRSNTEADYHESSPRLTLNTRSRPAAFLPSLRRVELDGYLEERWRDHDELLTPDGFFPRFVLGLPLLATYRGPTSWGRAPATMGAATYDCEQVDVATWLMPNVVGLPQEYYRVLDNLVRSNLLAVRFYASRNEALMNYLDAAYGKAENVRERIRRLAELTRKEEAERARQEAAAEAEAARVDAERQRELVLARRVEAFGETVRNATSSMAPAEATALFQLIMARAMERFTTAVPRHRHAPYFVRYDPSSPCYADPDDGTVELDAEKAARHNPYAVDRRGRQNACVLCGDVFRPEDHANDTDPIVNNNFLRQRNELELDMQLNRLGCIVVCNATDNDFVRNNYVVQQNETDADAIARVQCVHQHHFFHRVCYSIALYDNYKTAGGIYKCPHNNMRFYAQLA